MKDELNCLMFNNQQEINKIRKCNEYTKCNGLVLSEKEIKYILDKRDDSLKSNGRLEFGEWIVDKIIKSFYDSQYITQENYSIVIGELIDIFYYYKNETRDLISDDELIDFMKKGFNGKAGGDLKYLSNTILEEMTRSILNGESIKDL